MGFRSIAEETVLADGTEQIVLEVDKSGRFSGYIDLSEMQAGDTLRIRQYVAINGAYKRYATEQYSGAQSDPVVYITPKEVATRMKVTMEQTAGVFRRLPCNFVVEEIPGPKFKV
jgi:hypothetical protein